MLPTATKETLIAGLLGFAITQVEEHPIDTWRLKIMSFIIDHRVVMETQLTCPARSMQPDACFQCVDAQVVSCLLNNPSVERLIEAQHIVRRPVETQGEDPDMIDNLPDISTIKRDLGELQKMGAYKLRRLAQSMGLLDDDATKMSFINGRPDVMAQTVLDALKKRDSGGGNPTPPATVAGPSQPAAQVVIPGTGPEPQQTAPVKRQPRSTAAHTNGVAPAGDSTAVLQKLDELREELANNTAAINAAGSAAGGAKAFSETAAGGIEEIFALTKAIAKRQDIETSLLLLVAEAVLQDTRPELASYARSIVPELSAILPEDAQGNA